MFQDFGIEEVGVRKWGCGASLVHEPPIDPDLVGLVLGFFFLEQGAVMLCARY